MKRLFMAVPVELSPPFVSLTQKLQNEMHRDQIVWVKPELQHLTLRFLGQTPEHYIEPLMEAMTQVSLESEHFDLELNKLGVFGSKYAPAVLWYGFQDFSKFKELFHKIEPLIKGIGVESNYGNFVPHLTIGRIKKIEDKKKFTETVKQLQPTFSQPIPVKELQLIRSKLTPNGPKYTILNSFSLQ